jgi:hypothetical protein
MGFAVTNTKHLGHGVEIVGHYGEIQARENSENCAKLLGG